MYDTHTPTEWAAAGSLGVTAISLISLAMAFADADAGYFDPRYQLGRLVEAGRLDPLLIVVGPTWAAARDAVLDLAALVLLLTTSPKGALR
ncbi:hypothetical protein [Streptomyces sp. ALI-76-A]|uniref:hypothetical protein n=1 Tax=Streptomyces sp. ALI-76-A TaxID=3025736 RepID=UPI00256EA8DC|nr:hypothetical protein [Streptomyces sp. ALI-76-A]MDL5205071.1 hypothetical protein [Streptomyces sp. ALI-76-A]